MRVRIFLLVLHAGFEIDLALIAEARDRLTSLGIDCDQKAIPSAEYDTSGVVFVPPNMQFLVADGLRAYACRPRSVCRSPVRERPGFGARSPRTSRR